MIKLLKKLSFATALFWIGSAPLHADLVLVENGESRTPIVVADGLSPRTWQAVEELADTIQQIGGARPEIFKGLPDPMPQHALCVGHQPVLKEELPDVDLEFDHQTHRSGL